STGFPGESDTLLLAPDRGKAGVAFPHKKKSPRGKRRSPRNGSACRTSRSGSLNARSRLARPLSRQPARSVKRSISRRDWLARTAAGGAALALGVSRLRQAPAPDAGGEGGGPGGGGGRRHRGAGRQ